MLINDYSWSKRELEHCYPRYHSDDNSHPNPRSLQSNTLSREPTGDITKFNVLQGGPSAPEMDVQSLPELPSQSIADRMIETVYIYTQARYCIVDWIRVRAWHRQREAICYASKDDSVESQTGYLMLIQ